MKEIKMFMFESCPHCKKAREIMAELFAKHPEYKAAPLEMIDEKLHPDIADKYDYYYVPTFFVGGEKICEGVPTAEGVESVFKKALKE
ncbi:MAG: thioredoxin family protein [Synergistaceae bacterium]|nr:thioredoxin family protein [Synergistaceae bacterium]